MLDLRLLAQALFVPETEFLLLLSQHVHLGLVAVVGLEGAFLVDD